MVDAPSDSLPNRFLDTPYLVTVLASALVRLPTNPDETVRLPMPPAPSLLKAFEVFELRLLWHGLDRGRVWDWEALWDLLAQPLEDWQTYGVTVTAPFTAASDEPLLREGRCSDLCREIAVSATDVYDELDERACISALLNVCRAASTDQRAQVYSDTRAFFIRQAVVSERVMVEWRNRPVNRDVRQLSRIIGIDESNAASAYERIPETVIVDGMVNLCPYCGWTLIPIGGGRWRCVTEWCQRVTNNFASRTMQRAEKLVRLRSGIVRSIVVNERALLDLVDMLQPLRTQGLTIDLFPDFDRCDLVITFPDGRRWGADMKNFRDPLALVRKLNHETAQGRVFADDTDLSQWERAVYLIPDERLQLSPENYIPLVKDYWQALGTHPQAWKLQVMSASAFRLSVETRLARRQGVA